MLKNVRSKMWLVIGIAVSFLLIGLLWHTSSAKAMTMDDAKNLAINEIPKSAVYVDGKEGENKFIIMFYDKKNGERYIVEVSKKTQKIKKIEAQRDDNDGSKTISLKEADIEKIIKEQFPGVKGIIIELNEDDGLYEYDVDFKGDEFYGKANVNPETGIITEFTVKMGTVVTIPKQSKEIRTDPSDEKTVKKEQIKDAPVKTSDGRTPESVQEKYISRERVKNIVLSKIPGARIADLELDWEDGRHIYEVDAFLGKYEYEFEIDAISGVIIEMEKEAIEDND